MTTTVIERVDLDEALRRASDRDDQAARVVSLLHAGAVTEAEAVARVINALVDRVPADLGEDGYDHLVAGDIASEVWGEIESMVHDAVSDAVESAVKRGKARA